MPSLAYVKHTRINLRDTEYTEKWLQDRIAEDPSILGIPGDLELLDRERRQERAGRLDLVLYDREAERRYELELMLGSLDESHIIRTIEYWDLERRRYPGYEHIAVIVAEDVTGRFLSVLSLLAGTIPLIVLQCHALQIDGRLLLNFVKVMDQTSLRRDDEHEARAEPATREYWIERVGGEILTVCDRAVEVMNGKAKGKMSLNYLRQYININDGTRSGAFVHFVPKKKFVHFKIEVQDAASWIERIEKTGLDVRPGRNGAAVRVTVMPKDFDRCLPTLTELLQTAVTEYEA
ncbi:MAG: hypothetical protein WAT39_12925 [Planctomycetota bacterium]